MAAEVAKEAEDQVGRIVQLEETVINRIAAGEVVVRPANALKELIENSLDAGSKHIIVSVKAGGLKMLRIEDDGHGIRAEDLPILCERFTTSKLRKYEDLRTIGTFGFRGEALASISHVAHVTVTTMTAQDTCARLAQYSDGKLRAPPRPCAGTRGTTLLAEDLFYNNPTRRQALGKDSVEYAKVLEVVQKYSVHYPHVSFSCRKANAAAADLLTGGQTANELDVIASIYGQNLVRELFSFETECKDAKARLRGCATGPNWSARSPSLTVFINHRLVDCNVLRKALEAVYVPILPRHQHPWVYVSLELDPATIDVNVHPTKMEVQFLNEDLILQSFQEALQNGLQERGGSRTFQAQGALAGGIRPFAHGKESSKGAPGPVASSLPFGGDTTGWSNGDSERGGQATRESDKGKTVARQDGRSKVELNPLRVRTDHRQLPLTSVWRDSQATQPLAPAAEAAGPEALEDDELMDEAPSASQPVAANTEDTEISGRQEVFAEAQSLSSVAELRAEVAKQEDSKLSKWNQSVYVGPVNHELALLQCGSALCLANIVILARECSFQRLLRRIGGMGSLQLNPPLQLKETLRQGVLHCDSGYDQVKDSLNVEEVLDECLSLLQQKAELLREYFMMEIKDGHLLSVPNALGMSSDIGLSFSGLPLGLLRLCFEVNWLEEKPCLEGVCRVLADTCVDLLLPEEEAARSLDIPTSRADDATATAQDINQMVEAGECEDIVEAASAVSRKRARHCGADVLKGLQTLHEAICRDGLCRWPSKLGRDNTVLELVTLDHLYRIFERC